MHDRYHSETDCLQIAAALESASTHPIARAFARFESSLQARDLAVVIGGGVEGVINGQRWRLGSANFVGTAASVTDSDATRVFLATGDTLVAEFLVADPLRETAANTLTSLQNFGLSTSLVSGDSEAPVRRVAQELSFEDVRWGCDPESKLERIRELQAAGETVVMIGDGVNDAPVLSGADASIALSNAASLAQSSADVLMLGESLQPIATLIRAARKTMRIVRQNLTWAILYNLSAVPLAAAGLRAALAGGHRYERQFAGRRPERAAPESIRMNILYLLIPLALLLLAAAVWAFFWAVGSGQFDDLDTPAMRVIMDDDTKPPRRSGGMTELATMLATAFAAGLLGSAHCLGMCAGISGLFAVHSSAAAIRSQVPLALTYNVGRITSYAVLGFIVAAIGSQFVEFVPKLARPVRLAAGLLIVLIGLQIAFDLRLLSILERIGGIAWEKIAPVTRHLLPVTNLRRAAGLGLLWGLLPCGLVYSVLLVAAASAECRQWQPCHGRVRRRHHAGDVADRPGCGALSRFTQRRRNRLLAGLLVVLLGGSDARNAGLGIVWRRQPPPLGL